MSTLTWRTARDVRLTDRLIPNPNSSSDLLDHLREVRVAFDGAVVHIDPRPADASDAEYPVYVIPAGAVKVIHYQEYKPANGVYTA